MSADDTPLWLFADQLGREFYGGEHAQRPVLLVEATSALRRRRFHRQKLHLVLSAVRHAAADLGERATLVRAETYTAALRDYGKPVLVHEPTSFAADRFVRRLQRDGMVAEVLPTRDLRCREPTFDGGPGIGAGSGWRTSTASSAGGSAC